MDRYIGLDVHSASTTVAVVGPSGRRVSSQVIETNGRALVEAIRVIPGQRHVCLEEGVQSEWVYEILKPHVDEIVVARVETRRGTKSDERDAFGLAERLRTRAVGTPVFKDTGEMAELRELVRLHGKVVGDVVRSKNRVKCLFRSRGIDTAGSAVYVPSERSKWLKKLPVTKRFVADVMYAELDALEPLRAKLEQAMVQEAQRRPIARKLETCLRISRDRDREDRRIVIAKIGAS